MNPEDPGSKWQPIETAPHMRTLLLFAWTDELPGGQRNYRMATGYYHVSEYEPDGGYWKWEGRRVEPWEHPPAWWQELPDERPPLSIPEDRLAT